MERGAIPLRYSEFAPESSEAAEWALTYWEFTVNALQDGAFVHRIWPDGCVSLVLMSTTAPRGELSDGERGVGVRAVDHRVIGARIVGPTYESLDVTVYRGVRYHGIRFRPEAGAAWLGVDASRLRDANLEASGMLGVRLGVLVADLEGVLKGASVGGTAEIGALFDRWVSQGSASRRPVDELVRAAVASLVSTQGRLGISVLASTLGVSVRSLQRRFRSATSLTPKEYASLRRGRNALRRVVSGESTGATGGWSSVADAAGYADQSHLIREIARLTRFTPVALRERLAKIDHVSLVD